MEVIGTLPDGTLGWITVPDVFTGDGNTLANMAARKG